MISMCSLFIFLFIYGIGAVFYSKKGNTTDSPLYNLGVSFIFGSIIMGLLAHLPKLIGGF